MNKSEIKRLIAGYYILKNYENKEIIRRVKNYMNTGISMSTITDIRKNDIIPISIIEIEKIIEEYKLQIQNKIKHPRPKEIIQKKGYSEATYETLKDFNNDYNKIPIQNTNTRIQITDTKFSEKEIIFIKKLIIKATHHRTISQEDSFNAGEIIKKLEDLKFYPES